MLQVSSLYALYHPGCSWILDWSVFFAGFQIYVSFNFLFFCTFMAVTGIFVNHVTYTSKAEGVGLNLLALANPS